MVRSLILMWAAPAIALGSSAGAQTAPQAPKPVARADFVKSIDSQFTTVDANHDGKITKEEMAAQQERELQLVRNRLAQEFQARFKQLDTNKDGQLSVQEFVAAAPIPRANETADQVVQKLDSNRDGKVTLDEFRAPRLANFAKVDANHDGVITPAEIEAYKKAHAAPGK